MRGSGISAEDGGESQKKDSDGWRRKAVRKKSGNSEF